ncbi:MAG: acyclic terpene utilization AtuA family protein [Janthinobacterium lividum]
MESPIAPLRIGGGSAFFNDRLDAALELVEHGRIDVLMVETLAERTLAQLQAGRNGGQPGYFPRLADRLKTLLPACHRQGTRLVSNGGGAATQDAAAMAHGVATQAGLRGTVVAAVLGDDVAELVRQADPVLLETGERASRLGTPMLSANAYLGAAPIAEACRAGAHVVLTGRVTDSALALGPLLAHFGWTALDDLACGIVAGHLLECGGQATGGYFADPGVKDVPGLDRLGFPIAEVAADRSIRISKPPGTGGRIDRHVITEQLLYEVHNPARYITPDVVLDLTEVTLQQEGPEQIRLTGMRGHPAPDTLKVLIGVAAGQHVEVEISYAGLGARGRAELAADIIQRRLARNRLGDVPIRYDLMGVNALALPGRDVQSLPEVRLRVAARCPDLAAAELLVTEVESLYVNGPAGGGGVRFSIRAAVRTLTTFLPAADVSTRIDYLEVR